MNKIIDISEHNGNIDFKKIKENNITGVIIRIGWIGNKNNHTLDKKFEEYYKNAKSNNLQVGLYVYNYCKSIETLKTGINWVKQKLLEYNITLEKPLFLDMEDESIKSAGKETLTNMCLEFCREFRNNGIDSGIYANKDWFTNYLDVNRLTEYKIWLAEWTLKENHSASFKVDLWQYTDKGSLPGINGNVDLNKCFCETTEFEMTGKKSNEKIANEVIKGLWGNGEERKNRLTSAGYNYNDIQNLVNKMYQNKVTYIIKKGDTLWGIAKMYNTTVNKIAKENNIENPNKIYAGQTIKITKG